MSIYPINMLSNLLQKFQIITGRCRFFVKNRTFCSLNKDNMCIIRIYRREHILIENHVVNPFVVLLDFREFYSPRNLFLEKFQL